MLNLILDFRVLSCPSRVLGPVYCFVVGRLSACVSPSRPSCWYCTGAFLYREDSFQGRKLHLSEPSALHSPMPVLQRDRCVFFVQLTIEFICPFQLVPHIIYLSENVGSET